MAWIYFQESVESDLPLNHGLEPLPIVSVSDTHKAYFCHVCNQVRLIEHQSKTTSQHSEVICCQESTSSSEDFLVRISALQELVRAWMESEAVFSSRSSDLSKSLNQYSYFLKMYLQSGQEDLMLYSKNLPRSGMIVDGQLYRPQALEHLTSVKDGFSWPTPTVCGNYQNNGNMVGLATAVKKFPTPAARDWRDTGKSPSELKRNSTTLATIAGGQLNPQWVEWLMGYRTEFTALSASVTEWYLSKSKQRLKSY